MQNNQTKYFHYAWIVFIFISGSLFGQSREFTDTEIEFKADTVLAEAKYVNCTEQDSSLAGLNTCIGEYIGSWENILNKFYQKLLPYTSGEMRTALVRSQSNWHSYVDNDVALYYSIVELQLIGGTLGYIVGTYRATLVKERAIEMFHYYLIILDE